MCEFNEYVIYACICIHACIHTYTIYLYTFILQLQTAREKWSLLGNQMAFLQIYRTRQVLCHPLTATCRAGHRWDAAGGWGRSLPAVRGWRRRLQLSARDTEPTAPSRRAHRTSSLVLAEVCGWCCLTGLKMAVPDHLKQGQTDACGEPGGAALSKGSARPLAPHTSPPHSTRPGPPELIITPFWFREKTWTFPSPSWLKAVLSRHGSDTLAVT